MTTPIPPAPAEEARAITPESQPVFPCWLYGAFTQAGLSGPCGWYRATDHWYVSQHGWTTHWHPDQPAAPTVTPAHGEHQGKWVPSDVSHGDWMGALADELTKFYVGNVVTPFEVVAIIAKHVPANFPRHGQRPAQGKREATGTDAALLLAKVSVQLSSVLTALGFGTFTDRKQMMAENALEEAQKFLALAAPEVRPSKQAEIEEQLATAEHFKEEFSKNAYANLDRALAAEQKVKEVESSNLAEWSALMADVHDYFKDERADRGHGRVRLVLTLLGQLRCERDALRAQLQQVQAERDELKALNKNGSEEHAKLRGIYRMNCTRLDAILAALPEVIRALEDFHKDPRPITNAEDMETTLAKLQSLTTATNSP